MNFFNKDIPKDKTIQKYSYADSAFLQLSGANIHYRKTSAKTGENPKVLLLLHGLTSSLHTWEKWQEILSEDYTVISLDLLGFGLTGAPNNNNYSLNNYMNLLAEFMEKMGINSCSVAGNSFGGLIAHQLAFHYPERIKKLILIDATCFSRDSVPLNYRLYISPILSNISHNITPRSLVQKAITKMYGAKEKVTDKLVSRYHDLLLTSGNRNNFSMVLRQFFNPIKDYSSSIVALKQPTLIMWGERDAQIPAEHAPRLEKIIANARCIIYPGVGHLPMEEIPEESAKDALEFLKSNN